MDALRAGDPRRIGDYRLLGKLGEGGMGSVYLAQSPRGRTVAVKVVRGELAEQPDFRRRFAREVRAARQVGGEWTAPVLDAEPDAPQPWLATGYLPGVPLDDAVRAQPEPLPERTVRILMNRLARALGSVHGAGLIHRDVKPSNVLVTLDGPRLIDFGIARALEPGGDTQLTRTGAVVGSPAFMSPEQARGKPLTAASDIFSLGSTLVFAATGRVPFGDEGLAAHGLLFSVAEDEPRLTGVPEGLRELIAACLAKDAAERSGLAEIVARTADPADEPGPDGRGDGAVEPWLPAGLVAQLGRHAARLLDAEVPGAREAADRAAGADVIPPRPPEPPRTGFGPPPEPGNRRRTAVLAGAVALALVAGGTLLAVRAMDGSGGGGDDKRAGGEQGLPSPKERLKPASGGALPKEYLGVWQSDPKKPKGRGGIMYRVEIEQGDKGDTVGEVVSVRGDTRCTGSMTLAGYDGVMRAGGGNSNSIDKRKNCPRHGEQELVYRNGALVWHLAGTDEYVRLHRARGDQEDPLPPALVNRQWKMTGEAGRRSEVPLVRFFRGDPRTAGMQFDGTGKDKYVKCRWYKGFAGADNGTFVFAGALGDKACKDGDRAKPVRVRMHGDDEVRVNGLVGPGKPVILKRAR